MTHQPIGLWLDGGPGELAHLGELPAHGVTVAAIMVETSRAAWDPTWTVEQVGQACHLARGLDLEAVITVWPVPTRTWLDAATPWLDQACTMGVSAIEVDLEHLWKRSHLDGSLPSLEHAAQLLLLRLRDLAGRHDLRLEVTSHTGHSETSPAALVSPHVDVLVAQAYSIRERPGGEVISWDDRRMGPGLHQTWAAADARTVPGVAEGVALSLGLPLWGQRWPGHGPAEALDLAYAAAVAEHPREVRFWSSLNLRKNQYARDWLTALAPVDPDRSCPPRAARSDRG